MTAEPRDALKRLDSTADSLLGLWDILDAEEPLPVVLTRVAHSARRAIADVEAVTVTGLNSGSPTTLAWTDDRYLALDQAQYAADRGPSLAAARTRRAVRCNIDPGTDEHQDDWPEFTASARAAGVRVCMSVPLVGLPVRLAGGSAVAGAATDGPAEGELVGALNMFSGSTNAFDPFDESLTRLFSIAAAQAISNARRWQLSRDQVRNLEIAMHSRGEIDQAKGILMALRHFSADRAFAELVDQSQRRNVKLREIARELIDSVIAEPN